jgi:hypothetical protein
MRPPATPVDIDAEVEQLGVEVVETWGLLKRAKSYVSARFAWRRAGYPVRTEAEQLAIASICAACPKRLETEDGIACGICGCAVSRESPGVHSLKIRMGTEHCPDKPPRW